MLPKDGDAAFFVCQRYTVTDAYVFVAHMYGGSIKIAGIFKSGSFKAVTNSVGTVQVMWDNDNTVGKCIAFKWKMA